MERLVTELLHNGSYVLLAAHAFDPQKLLKPGQKQVRCNATVPASMLRYRYTSTRNLPTNLCFHIVREEAVLPIQLLFQIRDKLLQALFCESLLNPNFDSVPLTFTCVVISSITTNTQGKFVPVFCNLANNGNKKAGHSPAYKYYPVLRV